MRAWEERIIKNFIGHTKNFQGQQCHYYDLKVKIKREVLKAFERDLSEKEVSVMDITGRM